MQYFVFIERCLSCYIIPPFPVSCINAHVGQEKYTAPTTTEFSSDMHLIIDSVCQTKCITNYKFYLKQNWLET